MRGQGNIGNKVNTGANTCVFGVLREVSQSFHTIPNIGCQVLLSVSIIMVIPDSKVKSNKSFIKTTSTNNSLQFTLQDLLCKIYSAIFSLQNLLSKLDSARLTLYSVPVNHPFVLGENTVC